MDAAAGSGLPIAPSLGQSARVDPGGGGRAARVYAGGEPDQPAGVGHGARFRVQRVRIEGQRGRSGRRGDRRGGVREDRQLPGRGRADAPDRVVGRRGGLHRAGRQLAGDGEGREDRADDPGAAQVRELPPDGLRLRRRRRLPVPGRQGDEPDEAEGRGEAAGADPEGEAAGRDPRPAAGSQFVRRAGVS